MFLYNNNNMFEQKNLRKQHHLEKCQKKKTLRKELNKNVKDLLGENYKALIKKIKDDTNKWKYIPYLWTEKHQYC